MTGKVENYKSPNMSHFQVNPIWRPLLFVRWWGKAYKTSEFSFDDKLIKRDFNWIKFLHTSSSTFEGETWMELLVCCSLLCSFHATQERFRIFHLLWKSSLWSNDEFPNDRRMIILRLQLFVATNPRGCKTSFPL